MTIAPEMFVYTISDIIGFTMGGAIFLALGLAILIEKIRRP